MPGWPTVWEILPQNLIKDFLLIPWFTMIQPEQPCLLLPPSFLLEAFFLFRLVGLNPFRLKNPQRDSALISFAGPAANLILAIILSVLFRLNFAIGILPIFILLNISLAVFNLIPIHPLDGGKILIGLLPLKNAHKVDNFLNRFGFLILIGLIFPIFGNEPLINVIISPIIKVLRHILIPGNLVI